MTAPTALPAPIDVAGVPTAPVEARRLRDRAASWASAALSLAVLLLVATQLGRLGLDRLLATAPDAPAFWAVFALSYLCTPVCDWLIFRHLWRIPASGILALLRKEVSNELLFGYSGEAQFYLWARRHVPMAGSPFGAVKDVAMLSAVAGSAVTLLLMVVTAPMLVTYATTPLAKAFGGSVAIITLISFVMFVARRALFSLPRPALWTVFWIHILRVVATLGLTAVMWHLLLPTLALSGWTLLATLRMMISRMPLVANKDLLFAGLALLLLGRADGVADVVALVSGLVVVAHLVVGVLTYAAQMAGRLAGR